MFARLVLVFTLIPLAELFLLTQLGRRVGLWPTIGLVVFTGVLGAWLARTQGVAAWTTVRTELAAGRLPAAAMIDALLILLAGAVLLTPGLLTDLAGFFLLIPEGRTRVRKALAARWRDHVRVHGARVGAARGPVIVTDQYRERPASRPADGPRPDRPRSPLVATLEPLADEPTPHEPPRGDEPSIGRP